MKERLVPVDPSVIMIGDFKEVLLLFGKALTVYSLNVDLDCSFDEVLEVPGKGLSDLFW